MIYRLLAVLFNPRYADEYKAHPLHVVYSIFIMAIGTVTFVYDGWSIFGIMTFIIGALLGLVITFAIQWDKSIRYWQTVNEHVILMERVKNPELWEALGYKQPSKVITMIETREADNDNGYQMKFRQLPVSPVKMNLLANDVLNSNRTTVTLELLNKYVGNPRKIQKWLKDNHLIHANVIKNGKEVPTQGYSWNNKGMKLIYEYASDSVKVERIKGDDKSEGRNEGERT